MFATFLDIVSKNIDLFCRCCASLKSMKLRHLLVAQFSFPLITIILNQGCPLPIVLENMFYNNYGPRKMSKGLCLNLS